MKIGMFPKFLIGIGLVLAALVVPQRLVHGDGPIEPAGDRGDEIEFPGAKCASIHCTNVNFAEWSYYNLFDDSFLGEGGCQPFLNDDRQFCVDEEDGDLCEGHILTGTDGCEGWYFLPGEERGKCYYKTVNCEPVG